MNRIKLLKTFLVFSAIGLAFGLGRVSSALEASATAKARGRVFEIRTYTTFEGRLEALHSRFRNHTIKLFEKHGMTNIGYWSPQDSPLSQNTLIYILAHPDRDAAKKHWDEFRRDPEWTKARDESEASGKIVSKVESLFVEATDYSPIK